MNTHGTAQCYRMFSFCFYTPTPSPDQTFFSFAPEKSANTNSYIRINYGNIDTYRKRSRSCCSKSSIQYSFEYIKITYHHLCYYIKPTTCGNIPINMYSNDQKCGTRDVNAKWTVRYISNVFAHVLQMFRTSTSCTGVRHRRHLCQKCVLLLLLLF